VADYKEWGPFMYHIYKMAQHFVINLLFSVCELSSGQICYQKESDQFIIIIF
jgi:hypothetical protein